MGRVIRDIGEFALRGLVEQDGGQVGGKLDQGEPLLSQDRNAALCRTKAELVGDDLREDYVIPGPFDPRVPGAVSSAVAEAARRDGVARR